MKGLIFTITTLKIESGLISRSRTVGYTMTFSAAEKIVNKNSGDIYEDGYYNYAVIEAVEEGIYQYDENPKWFKWDKTKMGFYECERPNIPGMIGFSIG